MSQCLCSACCFGLTCPSGSGWKPGDGAVPSLWPGYLYDKPQPQVEPVKAPVKCDCGSEAAGLGDVHSDWCAKGRGP